jgi:predicted CXXCH cytochrome family protein
VRGRSIIEKGGESLVLFPDHRNISFKKKEEIEMRNSKLLLIGIGLLLIGALMYASKAQAGITGSLHDFSAQGWSGGQICIVCHTPHNAASGVDQIVPLWNHETTTATYTPYSNPSTLNATVGQPTGVSKACLSCHDGTVAIDSYGGATGTNFVTGNKLLGTNLSNDHPISFIYNDALVTADAGGGPAGLVSPASASLVVTGIPLFSSQMECASCHSVHNDVNGKFLRFSNAASALCLKCHIK